MSDQSPLSSPAEHVADLRRHAGELAALVADIAPAGPHAVEGEWSAVEVVAHLAHFEVLAGARIRMVLTLEKPPLAAFEQEDFNLRFADALPLESALALFDVNRSANCDLLERLQPADWERIGVHPRRGEESLSTTVAMLVRHDREHLEQLRASL